MVRQSSASKILYISHSVAALQAKEGSGGVPAKKWCPMLVSAGIALAPDTFQLVLEAESEVKGV